jgi:hypothetical protein
MAKYLVLNLLHFRYFLPGRKNVCTADGCGKENVGLELISSGALLPN